jgi:hypothetical protein
MVRGFAYFTTPNGDYVRNTPPYFNPDHVRHYTRSNLEALLKRHFGCVLVRYAVKTGVTRSRGLRGITARRPLRALATMASNVVSRWESRGLDETPRRTAHLIAVAWKDEHSVSPRAHAMLPSQEQKR